MNYDLSRPQNSIYFTEKFYNGSAVNNICGYVHITDKVNLDVLEKAINLLVKTNDGMRLKIIDENNSCKQYVSDFKEFSIETVKLSPKKGLTNSEILEEKALEFASIPFDVYDNLLFKFILFKLPDDSGGFIVNVHHLIGDSWSLGLIAKEATNIYSNLLNNTYVEETFPSYINYLEYEKEYINSDKFKKDKEYWEDTFKEVPEVASIPSFKSASNSSNISCSGNRSKFTIDKDILNGIKEFCTANKVSLYNFFMSVLSIYLGRVSNLETFVIGTPILNRTNFEQKHTMGMFISTIPLKIHLNHDLPFTDFCKQIGIETMSIFRHQRYSYNTILEDLRKKDSSVPNLYNVALSYQITKTVEDGSTVKYSTDWVFNGNCSDELQIHLFDLNDQNKLTVAYDYKLDKFDDKDISALHQRLVTIINQVLKNDAIILKDLEIVTPEEEHKILHDFNNTKTEYPRNKTITQVFEEQASLYPEKLAVVFEDEKINYKEFNEKINQMAYFLQESGVKSQDHVVIMAEKSIELYISIMAILKLGALYVPMDSEYPQERVDTIIEDCKPSMIIVDKAAEHLVEKEKHCVIPLNNLNNYPIKNPKCTITSRTRCIYYIYFWIYWKTKRCCCTS